MWNVFDSQFFFYVMKVLKKKNGQNVQNFGDVNLNQLIIRC